MLSNNILTAGRDGRASPAARSRGARTGRVPLLVSLAGHAVVVGLCLALIRSSVPPDAGPEVSVSLAFEAPQPALAPETAPPAVETPAAPDPPAPAAANPAPPVVAEAVPAPVTAAVGMGAPAKEPPSVADDLPEPPVPPSSPPRLPRRIALTVGRPPAQPPAAAQPVSGVPTAPTAPPPLPDEAGMARWQQALGVWLAAHKLYPEEARRRGEEGRVVVRFQVTRSGQVLDVALINGSGASRLDDATEAMLRGARLPAPPADMTQDPATVTVTIRYALSQ